MEPITNALVSVIIPTYNYAQYIEETLESVQAQTYPHWECIVVDDGSTDDTREIVLRHAQRDSRIKYIYQENKWQSGAKNNGIRNSGGKYLQFLDADDLIEPKKLQRHVQYLEQNEEVDIVYGSARYFMSDRPQELFYSLWGDNKPWMPNVSGRGTDILLSLVRDNIMVISSPLTRREVVEDVGCFDERLPLAEDWEFWLRCAIHGKTFMFSDLEGTLALIRSHPTSSSRDGRRRCKAILLVRKKIKTLMLDAEAHTINNMMIAVDEVNLGLEEVFHGSRTRGMYHLFRAAILDKRIKYRGKWFVCALSAPFLDEVQFRRLLPASLAMIVGSVFKRKKEERVSIG